jgi:hypothetical protein
MALMGMMIHNGKSLWIFLTPIKIMCFDGIKLANNLKDHSLEPNPF